MARTHCSHHSTIHRLQEKSYFVEVTNSGFEALYSYHDDPRKEYLERALDIFQCAIERCGADPACRATAIFNLATSKFMKCLARGTYFDLYAPIELYKHALSLQNCGHSDRPATLLLLAQALLCCLGQEYDESIATQIRNLLVEIRPDNSRERRTADAIMRICRLYRIVHSGNPTEVDDLVRDLDRGAYVLPYGYSDKPRLLHKLGLALWARFQVSSNFGHLEKSIALNEEALHLVPNGHYDQESIAALLTKLIPRRLEVLGDLTDVDMSVELIALGKKVIQVLDGASYGPPLEELREQIALMSAAAAAVQQTARAAPLPHTSEIQGLIYEWSNKDSIPTKCRRQLGELLSILGGEGETKMRELLAKVDWPFEECKVKETMQILRSYMPYFQRVSTTKVRSS